MKFNKTTLPNGVRVIVVPLKGNPSTTAMVLTETGSNDESKQENGLSHFLEHMCFKGTARRPSAKHVSQELDALGAYHNAFTSQEVTGYYVKAENRHFPRVLDVLADIYLHPAFPERDVEIERGVIIEEMGMYEDQPQAEVAEDLLALLYGETPAGRRIIGTRENLTRFTREDLVAYHRAHYVAGKTVVVVAGDTTLAQVLREVRKHFGAMPRGKKRKRPAVVENQKKPALRVRRKSTNQTHLIVSFRSFAARDKRAPALALLSNILGGGSSSRLHQKLRDELGACYYVGAATEEATDHGIFAVPVGINASRILEVVEVVLAECRALTQELVPEDELQRTKEYLVGKILRGAETSQDLAEYYASNEVLGARLETPRELERLIRKTTAEEVRRVAKAIFKNENLNLAVVGDVESTPALKKALRVN